MALNFHEKLLQMLDQNSCGIGIFIDLAKAFGTVNHSILIEKLRIYGFSTLLTSYLSDRTQTVVIDGKKSQPRLIKCGVPQGSILGPFLFIVYINDLPNAMTHCNATMFADDTTLSVYHRDILKLRELCLEDLSLWCDLNLLTLNASKTSRPQIN
eukprot:Lithocolla_globosa_v1_NODE_7403_length_951_cov_28.435268.p1 type:complete len:155 gc:universal NODE_7403_length_951_cov_28.435268:325-789(+)